MDADDNEPISRALQRAFTDGVKLGKEMAVRAETRKLVSENIFRLERIRSFLVGTTVVCLTGFLEGFLIPDSRKYLEWFLFCAFGMLLMQIINVSGNLYNLRQLSDDGESWIPPQPMPPASRFEDEDVNRP